MMPNHNTESDADLARNETDGPVENGTGPAEAPEVNAAESETRLADPDGGGAPVDGPDPIEGEQLRVPGDEPIAAVEAAEDKVAAAEPPVDDAEGESETGDETAPAEVEEEGLAAGAVAPVVATGAAVAEPPAVEEEEPGAPGDEAAAAEAEEEVPAAAAPVAAAAAAGAVVDEPLATDAEAAGTTGDEEASAEVEEEGPAADEPPDAEAEEVSETGDDAVPAEAEEEGLAAAAPVAAPVAAAAAAGAAIDGPPAVEGEEAGEAGGEALPAEADGAALPAAAVGAATAAGMATAAGTPAAAGADETSAAVGEGGSGEGAAQDLQDKKRRRLLIGLLALVALLIVAGSLFVRYLLNPGPLPDLLPLPVDVNYRPHYLFSIYGIENPVGVAVSPDGERIYATETSGEREVKVFDRDGQLLHSFSPPYTGPAERAPVYVAVGPAGRVFVTDRLQRAVFVYDRDGKLLDAILGPDLTLSEYVSKHVDGLQPDSKLAYNLFGQVVRFQEAGEDEQVLPAPDPAHWAPLGVRVDEWGTMLLTDVVEGRHAVREFPGELILASTWSEFNPPEVVFGAQGHESGEFMYPNSAVSDSKGRIFVTDGNNGRISVWDALGSFLFNFGRGVGENALSLPRGAAMDKRDRLHIVDAVDQSVKVYDVSEEEPRFLFAFGDWGTEEGEFNYPGDIALDGTGRLYIADRENNRIQVWSY